MYEYGVCLMKDNQDCRQNQYPLFTAGHCQSLTVLVHFKYGLNSDVIGLILNFGVAVLILN